jgi:hypothetical protein
MAIARCEQCGQPKATKPPAYGSQPHLPVGHPNSGIICGTKLCMNTAVIWLKLDEEQRYSNGERIFDIRTNSAKIQVQ